MFKNKKCDLPKKRSVLSDFTVSPKQLQIIYLTKIISNLRIKSKGTSARPNGVTTLL